MLFVTQSEKLAENIGKDEANGIVAGLRRSRAEVLDLRSTTADVNEAIAQVRGKLPGDYQGVVLIGGYDVVPPRRLDTIGNAIRARLNAIPDMQPDPDDFIVWNDDGYVDTDDDGQPNLPISRIPDGMTASLLRVALGAKLPNGNGKFGVRNVKRPFADTVWLGIRGAAQPMLTSGPATCETLDPAQLRTSNIYLMLHGEANTGKWFLGESDDGDLLKAIDTSVVTDVGGAVVFAGCCWARCAANGWRGTRGRPWRGRSETPWQCSSWRPELTHLLDAQECIIPRAQTRMTPASRCTKRFGRHWLRP